jgi:hypothetical protein
MQLLPGFWAAATLNLSIQRAFHYISERSIIKERLQENPVDFDNVLMDLDQTIDWLLVAYRAN